jgi:nicotinamidase-related amidase
MAFVENMIQRLVNLVNQARAHDFPICFVRTSGNQWTNSPVWTEFKNPDLLACAEGTWGAEFHEGLEPRPGDMIVTKHRYSAFIGTDLDMLLRARGVKMLVTGVGTGMCVFHTLTVASCSITTSFGRGLPRHPTDRRHTTQLLLGEETLRASGFLKPDH